MPDAATLDVKVVYTASKRQRRDRKPPGATPPTHSPRYLLLGVLNLLVAGGLYYGAWWRADPELRFLVVMHTPLPGVDVEAAASALGPDAAKRSSRTAESRGAAPDARAETAQAVQFVGTIVGWITLTTVAVCALAMAGGAILGQAGRLWIRRGGLAVGVVALGVVIWEACVLWGQHGRFVPDQLRTDVGAVVLIVALIGLVIRRWGRRLTLIAAVALIVSAGGSAYLLYVLARYGAVKAADLPLPVPMVLAIVFVMHSLWGWLLLPISSRIRR